MPDIAISAHEVSKRFTVHTERATSLKERVVRRKRSGHDFYALRDVSVDIEHGTTVGRPPLPEALSDPALTGMSRQDLQRLTERLALPHAAAIERRRHRQRGGDRTPGTRRGVFKQRLTDTERILATVLYQRKLCTREVLAEAFSVSRGTISNAITEVTPSSPTPTSLQNPPAPASEPPPA